MAKLLREQMVEESIYQLNKEGGQIGMQNGLQIGDSVSQVGAQMGAMNIGGPRPGLPGA